MNLPVQTEPNPVPETQRTTDSGQRRPAFSWNPRSVALIVLAWLILHIGCLFTPGLLDDVDSIYIEIAREMLLRRDFVTPRIDGIRFFDKPPLMYWLAAASMRVFGAFDWAARLPIAFAMLALLLATYALALRLFHETDPANRRSRRRADDRAALYSALALATSIGPFLYTRFFIPDILICLWLTLAVHAFLVALDRIPTSQKELVFLSSERDPDTIHLEISARSFRPSDVSAKTAQVSPPSLRSATYLRHSALFPCLAFAAVTALNLLTKGFIGLVFPIAFVLLYLAFTRRLRLLVKFHLIPSTLLFLGIAAPWHILAALRNPAIALPPGLGLPARGGWAWFYLYNEHIARFLQRRIPHDYGQVPVWLFWLLAALWLFPWTAFLPGAILHHVRALRRRHLFTFSRPVGATAREISAQRLTALHYATHAVSARRKTAFVLLLWAGIVLLFFTFSARQEYYSLPALPALALMAGGILAAAGRDLGARSTLPGDAAGSTLRWHLYLLVPIGTFAAAIALFFAITAPRPDPHTDIAALLAQGGNYNLSLSHIFDLTGRAMGLFRTPLAFVALSMITIGPVTWMLRRQGHTHAANLTLAAAALCLLLCVHEGLVRFYPTLGSKGLAEAILADQNRRAHLPGSPADLILIDGELTSGSTLLFYTRQPVDLVNGRINGPWYGSFWPDAPRIFQTDATLRQLWSGPRRLYLLTYHSAERTADLTRFGHVHVLASSGGKSILTNRP